MPSSGRGGGIESYTTAVLTRLRQRGIESTSACYASCGTSFATPYASSAVHLRHAAWVAQPCMDSILR
jgi:hypothetical protein